MKASPDPGDIAHRLGRLIRASGPISVASYMAEANAFYYATRDPLGRSGDFTTAPEISQVFGELVGLWLADLWLRAGSPAGACYVELGPGRGTLAADALRAMRSAGLGPEVHFVETSPVLRAAQEKRVPGAFWHDDCATLPADRPLLIVANEFFDALPVRQVVSSNEGWRELLVDWRDGRFERVAGPLLPLAIEAAPAGTIVESAPAVLSVARELARRLAEQGGAALIVDYGHVESTPGDSLQAVERHGFADPWTRPGARDLTAFVDFAALKSAALGEGALGFGPSTQGQWLGAMGIDLRFESLARAAPDRREELAAARLRLTAPDQMGTLFKAMALTAPDWPRPSGFDR